ncbi:PIG-L family deacetylase [Terriglobus sp.]|uniref:PIG-L family deacetylase n=1 Tax=Terriglobus sp. TaxID=1889013 RepID=UPI003B008B5C
MPDAVMAQAEASRSATPQSAVPWRQQQDAYAEALPFDRGAVGLAQTLRKLRTRASLIQINAHPDDEDGGMLAYESRAMGADVSLLSLNRGEGGQNVMTGDFWDALGILRTQEHLQANHYYGDHLYYTRVADFGFSKTLQESLAQWGHDRVLEDVVRVVRTVRPMVVTSVFAGYVSDGHGHHQTSGVMAQEVYTAAADPKMFPDQIKEGLRPWTPLKVYARVPFARVTDKGIFDYATGKWEPVVFKNYVTGEVIHHVPSTTLTVPEGTYDPALGESYFQLAREGLNEQKSQNGGVGRPPAGQFDSPYHLYATRVEGGTPPAHEDSFYDGIDTTLPGIAGYLKGAEADSARDKLQSIAQQVTTATEVYNALHPEKCAPALAQGLAQTRALIAELEEKREDDGQYNALHELRLKEVQFQQALNQALGMQILAIVQPQGVDPARVGPFGPTDAASAAAGSPFASTTVIPGQAFAVAVHVADQGVTPVQVNSVRLVPNAGDWKLTDQSAAVTSLAAGQAGDVLFSATVPQDAPLTEPYFSRPSLEQSYYDIHNSRDLTLPTMPYPLTATMVYTYSGVAVSTQSVVQTARRETGLGIVLNPLLVAPAISVRVSPPAGIMPLSATTLPLDVTVHSSVKGPASGTVALKLPAGWAAQPATAPFSTTRDNEDVHLHFTVDPRGVQAKQYIISAVATANGKQYTQGFYTIGWPGIRPYPLYAPAAYKTTGVDVKTAPSLRVAYVMGTGDDVPRSLQNLGIHVTELSAGDLAGADLSGYDAIVLGIRTYAARPELRVLNNRLLDYVHNGGVVISQYQTAEYDRNYGPYPLSVPGDAEKVVEETGEVKITKPDDPVFNWPNKITLADFNGWVEERGHGFLRSYDSHYVAPTEMHDAGQDPQTGGLVYAQYGKGYYVYLAFAFFREMPEGVPGSYRIMADLLSIGKNPNLPH